MVEIDSCLIPEDEDPARVDVIYEIVWDGEVPIWHVGINLYHTSYDWEVNEGSTTSGRFRTRESNRVGKPLVMSVAFSEDIGGSPPGSMVFEVDAPAIVDPVEPCHPEWPGPKPWTWPFDPNARFEATVGVREGDRCTTGAVDIAWEGEIPITAFETRLDDGDWIERDADWPFESYDHGMTGDFSNPFLIPPGDAHVFTTRFYAPHAEIEPGTLVREITTRFELQNPLVCRFDEYPGGS